MMREMIQDFINNEIIEYTDEWGKNGMIWERAGELGLLCIDMPEQCGGSGLDFSFNALFIEEMGKKAVSGPGFSLHSDIVASYLLRYGTEAQKQKYLPRMVTGQLIISIAMTEPNCDSDLRFRTRKL